MQVFNKTVVYELKYYEIKLIIKGLVFFIII